MLGRELAPSQLPWGITWIAATLGLVVLSTIAPGAALALAWLALLVALLLNVDRLLSRR